MTQEEDLALFIFIAVAVSSVVLIIFVVRSSKKNRATEPAYQLSMRWEEGNPRS